MSKQSRGATKKFLYFLLIILIIAGSIEFALHKILTSYLHVTSSQPEISPATLLLNANDIPFKASDGTELHGWLIQGKPGSPAMIIAHDYGSNRSETLGKLEALISALNKQGYFIFIFDFRGHGNSKSPSTLGYKERLDLEAALKEVLKYKQIEPRIGVLGIGMGAIAASETCGKIDAVKFVMLDTIYDDIPAKFTQKIIDDWPFTKFAQPALLQLVHLNFKYMLQVPETKLNLAKYMPDLYPKPVLFVERNPVDPGARSIYEATKEPKELIQLGETASGELIGDVRTRYKDELEGKILQYFPPAVQQTTLEIGN
jgi:pimeloyl-ACP methyl ester carboxylesterase